MAASLAIESDGLCAAKYISPAPVAGESHKDLVVECLKAGAVDFVVKPVDREVLLNKVARFLAG